MKNKIRNCGFVLFVAIFLFSCDLLDIAENEQEKSSDAQLISITINSTSISNFFGATYRYDVDVKSDIDSVTVTPVASDSAATVTVNSMTVNSGEPSNSVSLDTGENTIDIIVTAEDGTILTYNLIINRASAIVATSLTITNDWNEGLLAVGEEVWYSFSAASGTDYTISWDGYYDSMGADHTADIAVSAFDELNGGTAFFTETGVSSTETITPGYTGLVYIKVNGRLSGSNGTFGIKITQ